MSNNFCVLQKYETCFDIITVKQCADCAPFKMYSDYCNLIIKANFGVFLREFVIY